MVRSVQQMRASQLDNDSYFAGNSQSNPDENINNQHEYTGYSSAYVSGGSQGQFYEGNSAIHGHYTQPQFVETSRTTMGENYAHNSPANGNNQNTLGNSYGSSFNQNQYMSPGAQYSQQATWAAPIVHSSPQIFGNLPQNPSSFPQNEAVYGADNSAKYGWISAFGTGGLPGEPSLLNELGINFSIIRSKTFASLNPFRRLDHASLSDADMSGPLLFCFLYGLSLLLTGKVHFGYIYGVATLGWLSIYFILNLMNDSGVTFYLVASVLGYCLLPMVVLSTTSILLQLNGLVGMFLGLFSVIWCTLSSSTIFVAAFNMKDQQLLIAYPISLFYSCFALMTIF